LKVRKGAVIRGAGVALACLASSTTARSRVLFAAYAVGWPLDKPGLQVFVVIPDTDEPWKRATVPFATSVASWSTVMLVATTAVRRTKVPAPVAAVLFGGAAVALDSLLADLGERRQAATIAAVGSPDEADAEAELGAEGEYEAEAGAADE
jgi:NADPH:quinone reductase-like Zn-dependent oxidoreductase